MDNLDGVLDDHEGEEDHVFGAQEEVEGGDGELSAA